ncbi:MAG: hypothetical protein ACRDJW_07460 [Thermomicrobiales bacterium]
MGDAAACGVEAVGELLRRGLPQAQDVVTVNDGAEWMQGFVDLPCPQAHRVLDFAHAAGYLAAASTEAYGEGTAAAQHWFTTQRHTLRHGKPDAVLAARAALPDGAARDDAVGYLTTRRSQIADRDFAARGWPIGSGCVESAHKGVVQQRLKQRGMRWSRPVAAGMLALRLVAANDRWAATWPMIVAHQRADRQARAAQRRTARQTRPPHPTLVQDGKPTADHPWRRFRLAGSPRNHHRI